MSDNSRGKQFSSRVIGTVVPVLAMFRQDGALDETAIADYVEFLIGAGVGTLMCTVGSSRYDVMTATALGKQGRGGRRHRRCACLQESTATDASTCFQCG